MSIEKPRAPHSRKARQSKATRQALVAVARPLFAERGYAATSMEEVVRRTGVTRGALYHQFEDKRDLFRTVVEQAETQVARRVRERVNGARRGWDRLVEIVEAVLEAYADPEIRRLVLLDGPAVLGGDRMARLQEGRDIVGRVQRELEGAMAQGVLEAGSARPLAHFLVGALREAASVIAQADDPQTARGALRDGYLRVLEGLRAAEPRG